MVTVRGSVAVVRRATASANLDLSMNRAWATVNTALPLNLSVMSRRLAQDLWGLETVGLIRAVCALGMDIREADGLQVKSGMYAGKNLRVVGVRDLSNTAGAFGTDHLELALELSPTETFA